MQRNRKHIRRLGRALVLLAVMASSARGAAAIYSNVINEGAWTAESSRFECRLVSTIPYYGEAVFRKSAGDDEIGFLLDVPAAQLGGELQVRAEAPLWRRSAGTVDLGVVSVPQHPQPLRLPEQDTMRILEELHSGREVTFIPVGRSSSPSDSPARPSHLSRSSDSHEAGKPARLALTSIAFRRAYQAYEACLADLLPVSFDQIKRTAVYFGPGQVDELPDEQVAKLETILAYAEADRYLKEIYIDGHTDRTGSREDNLQLAERRARLVTDYLVKRGMPEDRIVMRWHGERYPVSSAGSADGRAQNRRVTIRLERVEPVNIPPLAASASAGKS